MLSAAAAADPEWCPLIASPGVEDPELLGFHAESFTRLKWCEHISAVVSLECCCWGECADKRERLGSAQFLS